MKSINSINTICISLALACCCFSSQALAQKFNRKSLTTPSSPTCSTILCAVGSTCVDSPTGSSCVPSIDSSAGTLSQGEPISGSTNYSYEEPTGYILTCATVLCAYGAHCEQTEDGPVCVGSGNRPVQFDSISGNQDASANEPSVTCDSILCVTGYTCVQEGENFPECVPDGTASFKAQLR